jgi:hypothetical protein
MQVLDIKKRKHQIISHNNKFTHFDMTTKRKIYFNDENSFVESALLEGNSRTEQRFILSRYDPSKLELKPGYHRNFIENMNLYDFKNFCGYFIKLNYVYSCSPLTYYLFQEKKYAIIRNFAQPILPVQVYEELNLFNLLQKNDDFFLNKQILSNYFDKEESFMKSSITAQLGNLLALEKK